MQEYPHHLNEKGSIYYLSLEAYIIILAAKLVSIFILPPLRPSAIN